MAFNILPPTALAGRLQAFTKRGQQRQILGFPFTKLGVCRVHSCWKPVHLEPSVLAKRRLHLIPCDETDWWA